MSEIEVIYTIWLRDIKIYVREKERLVSSLVSPLLWIFVFGAGLGSKVDIEGYNYLVFVYPGILVMTIHFTSFFYGMYIIWDRKANVLIELLVAPASRMSIFAGKMLGGATDAMGHVIILLVFGIFIDIKWNLSIIIESLLMLLLITVAMVSIGLAIGANLKSFEGFNLVSGFFMWPMFFLSGSLFPVSNLPPLLAALTYINPLTYGVDAVRGIILGIHNFPMYLDIAVMLFFSMSVMVIGALSFRRMK